MGTYEQYLQVIFIGLFPGYFSSVMLSAIPHIFVATFLWISPNIPIGNKKVSTSWTVGLIGYHMYNSI